jgi:transcriptional regulator with XRE-family HTH domain
MPTKADIAATIKAAMDSQHMSCKVIAHQMGVHDRTVTDWRRGRYLPSPYRVVQLSRLLGIEETALLERPLSVTPHNSQEPRHECRRSQLRRCGWWCQYHGCRCPADTDARECPTFCGRDSEPECTGLQAMIADDLAGRKPQEPYALSPRQ